ncbi:hypothetical protein VE03_00034 [Pseudogymnoascus sp. 23342-1-I1]|nr:hypothetical protein VE03_00034 [Pseudogymnoascus sp. 23342-1-I1]
MPSKPRIRLTFNRDAYTDEERYGRPVSNQQTRRSCTPPSAYSPIHPLSYDRTRSSHSPPGSQIASEVVYRSPFRGRITSTSPRSPKRQKLQPGQEKSLLVLELFVFLTAYTTLSEEQRIWVVENVFKDVDWEACADMDEGKGDGLGDLYSLNDQNDAGPGQVCRWILELSETRITTAFGDLVNRIIKGGWEVEGSLIPPAVETGVNVQNWTVVYDHTGSTEPIRHQAVPELELSEASLCGHDPMDLQMDENLDQVHPDMKEKIGFKVDDCEERKREARERYWRLVGERASLAFAAEACDNNSTLFSDMASAVSTADLSSIRSSNSATALSRTQVDDWVFNCISDSANSKPPLLEPFPPFRRPDSPKRTAADAGFEDQWGSGDVPTDAEEEERMMQHALRASMRVSAEKSPSPSINSAIHWENAKETDLNKVPWLNSRFRGSIFYNNPPIVPFPRNEEPLIVRQAMVDLGSGSEPPPPPPENNKVPKDRVTEDVDIMDGASKGLGGSEMGNQGIDMEASEKVDEQRQSQKAMPDSREEDEVITGTVEEIKHPSTGRGEQVEPVTETVDDLVRTSTEEAQDIEYEHSDIDFDDVEEKYRIPREVRELNERLSKGPQNLTEALDAEAATVLAERPKSPTCGWFPGHSKIIKAKERDEDLEKTSKEKSEPRKWDKVKVVDFANFAENKAAYQKAKAEEEAEPGTERKAREPDMRDFEGGHKSMQRQLDEQRREEERKADQKRRKEGSEGGRAPRPPVKSMIDDLLNPEPQVTAGPSTTSGGAPVAKKGGASQPPVKSMIDPLLPPEPQVTAGPLTSGTPAEPGTSAAGPAPTEPVEPSQSEKRNRSGQVRRTKN